MAKIKVQAQRLKPGDIVGSGEKVTGIIINSIKFPSNRVLITLAKYANSDHEIIRHCQWGKYTMIGVERAE